MNYQQELEELLYTTIEQNASDLHINVGRKPTLRIDGVLRPLIKKDIVTPQMAENLILALMDEQQKKRFLANKELDFSYTFKDKARFRINSYFSKGYMAASLRFIPTKIKTIEELNLPPVLHEFAQKTQGFFLVVGPAGCGKSTTLAAMIDEINHIRNAHIITIEDPIEYLFTQDKSIIDQREVYFDTKSFYKALKSSFRQDPDILMVGEMRDPETMSAAITAAETGHLVLSTLHTNNAAQTIDRIIDSFPANQQGQIRIQLANTLLGVLSQRLIAKIDGGRIPACELMIANAAIRNLIRENKIHQIDLVIETSTEEGMISLNKSLANLVRQREISLENALLYSLNPKDLRDILK